METLTMNTEKSLSKNYQNNTTDSESPQLSAFTDSQLYTLCKEYGKNTRKWQREFAFLLPEVAERRLHLRRKYQSIYEFAGKLAGMSHNLTKRILSLHGKLKDKPLIWNSFRRYGWGKLELIRNLATVENQDFWLDKLEKLPKAALAEYIKVWKIKNNLDKPGNEFDTNNLFDFFAGNITPHEEPGLQKPINLGALEFGEEELNCQTVKTSSVQAPTFAKLKFNVDRETEFQLRKFQKEISKSKGESLTLGETLKAMFEELQELRKFKEEMATKPKCKNKAGKTEFKKSNQQQQLKPPTQKISSKPVSRTISRRIPSELKRTIIEQYNHRCSEPDCNKPYTEIHHPNYFALNPNHENLKPLCHAHHQLAHARVNVENQHELTQDSTSELIDQKVRQHWNSDE